MHKESVENMSHITMRDIGSKVGVSAVTVSKALSGRSGVSEEMRQKIIAAAAEMGYVNPLAQQAEARQSLDIGILMPDHFFSADSFYAMFYKQVVKAIAEAGHYSLMELLSYEDETQLALPKLITNRRVDGLILLGQPQREYLRMIAKQSVPVIFLDFYDEFAEADSVVGDNSYGCFRLTSHLIKNGHREIGFVGNIYTTTSIMDRYLGFYKAMLWHNLPVREEWIIKDRNSLNEYIEIQLPEKLPTALVCNFDIAARYIIRQLAERGLRVPEDISVVGFDDYSPNVAGTPALSTFRVNLPAMAQTAVRLLTERCNGTRKTFNRSVISGQPIYRDSERPLN